MKDTPLVIYHGDCPDGFGAAFSAWLVFGDKAEYVPVAHDNPPPDVTGREVFILDFSFDRDVMAQIDAKAASLTMLDHHKSAQDKLHGFKCRCGVIHFDLTRSGARLAWEYFHPDTDVPEMIKLIEDRDLWKWKFPHTADYLAALDAEGFSFTAWKRVLDLTPGDERDQFITRGQAMNLKFAALCADIAKDALPLEIDGVKGLMVSASSTFASQVGNILATRSGTFGAIWKLNADGTVKVGLRSNAPFEVLPIASRFGGGGHPQASAFRVPLAKLSELAAGKLSSKT